METPKRLARRPAGSRHPTATRLARVDRMTSALRPSDGGSFAEISAGHEAQLHRVALRLSGNPEVAKDLVQETLVRALLRFAQFRAGTHAGTWLVAILTHLYFDYLKHQKVERKAEPQLMVPEAVEHDPTISTVSDTALHVAVQALEPELREVIELCYLQQMRYRDAADVLNVPMGTIGTRLMRARTRLRELLTDAGGEK